MELESAIGFSEFHVAAHPQVNEEVVFRKLESKELASAADFANLLPSDRSPECPYGWEGNGSRPAHLCGKNGPPHQLWPQDPGYRFDLGKLRHKSRSGGWLVSGLLRCLPHQPDKEQATGAAPCASGAVLLVEHLTDAAALVRTANHLTEELTNGKHCESIPKDAHLFRWNGDRIGGDDPLYGQRSQVLSGVGR